MKIKRSSLRNASRRLSRDSVCVKNSDDRLKKAASTLLFSALFIAISSSGFANQTEQKNTYGPIKAGQTLWDIAEETRANKDISIEQQVYALYKTNPEAFQSSNMNVLRKGISLRIPNRELVTNISNQEAKKQLSKHVHAIEVLRVDAKQLRTAKANTRQYKKRIKKIQKKLAKYRYESRDWNRTYLKLVTAKRNYKKSKRNVTKLNALLLEKATLKYTRPSKKGRTFITDRVTDSAAQSIADNATKETNKRLSQIQSSLSELNQSNATLTEKVNELASLNERVVVIEEELGKNDEVVLQLKNTLEILQKTIQKTTEEQLRQNEKHQQEIEKLSALKEKTITTVADVKTAPKNTEVANAIKETSTQAVTPPEITMTKETTETKVEENKTVSVSAEPKPETAEPVEKRAKVVAEAKEQNKPEKTITKTASAEPTPMQTETSDTTTEKEASTDTNKLPVKVETKEAIVAKIVSKEDKNSPGFTPDKYIKMQALKAGITPEEVKAINDENSARKAPPEETKTEKQPQTTKQDLTLTSASSSRPVSNENIKQVAKVEDASDLGFTPTEYIKMQALKAGFSPAEIESLSEEKTKEAAETLSTAKHLSEVLPKLKETNKKLTKFQGGHQNPATTNNGAGNLLGFLKENIILIGGLLNGLILLFVIFRIRANKQSPLTVEDFKPEKPTE